MMETRMSFRTSRVAGFSPLLIDSTRSSSARGFISRNVPGKLAAMIISFALVSVPAHLAAQQAYPSSPYGAYGSPYGNSYAQPAPQYGYGQPQYPQQQPGYAQPQYAAPQQPYAQQPYPQQPDAQEPDAQQPYSQEQPYSASPYPQEQDLAPQPSAPAQALSADQLEQMLAPIALYPDSLLAQILAASTYPAQVAVADQWLHQMQSQGYGSPDQIAAGANAQTSWDPSVKALTAFPDVLDMLNRNLDWTTALGNAYYNQPGDVMQTVQVLRQRAEQAGNLQSTPQEDVNNNQGYIDVAPPNPEQVYVPTYDPWDVYGQPISPYPGFSLIGALGDFFGSSPIQYALSFGLGAFERFPFGWLGWGLDWLGNAVLFNHGSYYTHSMSVADWGLPHGGPRAYGWRGGDRWQGGYNRAYGSQRAFDQHGSDPRGFNQPGGSAGNRNFANRNPGQSYLRPSIGVPYRPNGEAFNRGGNEYNRGSGEFNRGVENGSGYTHAEIPARQMYGNYNRAETEPGYTYRPQTYPNRAPAYASRPQAFTSPGYGYGYAGRGTQQAYAARPGFSYARPSSNYRAPQSYAQPYASRGFTSRSYGSYGNSFARSEQHSGGFHLFGHSSQPRGFSGGSAPKFSYGGGHSSHSFGGFGGGHSSHSFGGSHSSHSFGGGHGSSHSSGGHRR